jgi:predicted phage terminase large subunit-like protein
MQSKQFDLYSLQLRSITTLDAMLATRDAEKRRGSAENAARSSLAEFARLGWHVLEPTTPLIWNWHIDAICEHLEAVTHGRIRRLLINVPPGHLKSLLVAVFWPAWVWLHDPSWRAIFASYSGDLSIRDSVRCRDLLESEWYQGTFRPSWEFKTDQNVKSHFENTARGSRSATSVGGKGTGFRADCVVFDDPLNVEEYPSERALAAAISWWDKRMSSRLNDMRTGARIGIMQRLHENDPSGHLIRRKTYVHLNLPTEFDPDKRCETKIGFRDPRTEHGQLLFPEMFPPAVIAEAKEDLGEYGFAGQHNQNPAPAGGGIFKTHWFRFWYRPTDGRPPRHQTKMPDGEVHFHEQCELPDRFDELWQSWDMAFKKTASTDRIAGQVWGVQQARRFLLSAVCRRMSFIETLEAVRNVTKDFPAAAGKLVEDKANGPAVMNSLEDEIGGLIPVEPHGSKEARAHAVSPIVEAGNVYLPHPALYPATKELMHVLTTFPNVAHDDEVDAFTQFLNELRERGFNLLEALTQ